MLFNKGLALCSAMVLAAVPYQAMAQSTVQLVEDDARDSGVMLGGSTDGAVRTTQLSSATSVSNVLIAAPVATTSTVSAPATTFNSSTFLSGEWFSSLNTDSLRTLLSSLTPATSNLPGTVTDTTTRDATVVETVTEVVRDTVETVTDAVAGAVDAVVDTVVAVVDAAVGAVTGTSQPTATAGVTVPDLSGAQLAGPSAPVVVPPAVDDQAAPAGPSQPTGQLPAVEKTFDVYDRAQLWTALNEALNLSGAIIRIHPGNYGSLLWKKRLHTKGRVFLVAATAEKPVFTKMDFGGSQNIAISGVKVASGESVLISFYGAKDVLLTDSMLTSANNDRNPWDNGNTGIHIRSAADVTVSDVTFEDLRLAIYVQRSANVIVRYNTMNWLREGMNVAATDRFLLHRNYFTEFHPNYAKGEHPDTVQFWNVNETAGVSNSKLIENVMIHGGCRAVQGFFLGAERAAYWHSNLEIRGNVYYGSSPHGISVSRTNGLKLANNVVVASPNGDRNNSDRSADGKCSGGYSPRMRASTSTNVEAFNNVGMTTPLLADGEVKYDNWDIVDAFYGGLPWADVFVNGRMTSDTPALSEFVTKDPSLTRTKKGGILEAFPHGMRKLGTTGALLDALAAHAKGA